MAENTMNQITEEELARKMVLNARIGLTWDKMWQDSKEMWLNAARIAIRELSTWRPINTAPKDGTEILVRTRTGKRFVAQWNDSELWQISRDGCCIPVEWQPLPPPPQNETANGD